MILQRDTGAAVWGSGATPGARVTVSIVADGRTLVSAAAACTASANGEWLATVVHPAADSVTLRATDGESTAQIEDVAFGVTDACRCCFRLRSVVLTGPATVWRAVQHGVWYVWCDFQGSDPTAGPRRSLA